MIYLSGPLHCPLGRLLAHDGQRANAGAYGPLLRRGNTFYAEQRAIEQRHERPSRSPRLLMGLPDRCINLTDTEAAKMVAPRSALKRLEFAEAAIEETNRKLDALTEKRNAALLKDADAEAAKLAIEVQELERGRTPPRGDGGNALHVGGTQAVRDRL